MRMIIAILALCLAVQPVSADEVKDKAHDAKAEAKDHDKGHDAAHKQPDILEWKWDTAVWTCVVFILLFFVLSKYAWGPILEGLKAREATITNVMEEAKRLRDEHAKESAKFRAELQEAYAKIPAMMEEARKNAAELKEQIRVEGNAEVQKERQRLLREIDIAKDQALQNIWTNAANVATLIASKAVGRNMTIDDQNRLVDEALDELKQKASAN
jgi:F-type H+-transporting ATPase subunit b